MIGISFLRIALCGACAGALAVAFGHGMSLLGDTAAFAAAAFSFLAVVPAVAPVAARRRRLPAEHRATPPLTRFDLGYAAFTAMRYDDAVVELEQVLAGDPGDIDAWYYLGVSLAELGRHGDAAVALRQVVERRPRDARAFYHLGIALAETGQYFSARRAMQEAIRLDPRITRCGHSHAAAAWWETLAVPAAARRASLFFGGDQASASSNIALAR